MCGVWKHNIVIYLFLSNRILLTFHIRYVHNSISLQWKPLIYLNRYKTDW